ncbi:NADH:ubiquinone oxidoreductase [Stutzerimonas kirkiae]|uniref:NADH:ubiquinone oxidoreductase n=1 Tax=Stutzerimonas kirkiae TaxID=2211392 RepID=UPI00103859D8|nr:NADH:ubiquinone oxidoreductase [Stutzerimonas kirkiae]TBV07486.1 NADH:ubiquinone oxidoreductase [Stutzerimonas kirkiae]TBV15727.1 NADH:ubiquinone oxidoreductase [Stutzerimonas kirkiae]
MRLLTLILLLAASGQALAEACLIVPQEASANMSVCQQNRSIPPHIFRAGFCQPRINGRKATVSFTEQCPGGAIATCRNAQTPGTLYRQDILYYGSQHALAALRNTCERRNNGVWLGR